MDAIVVVPDDFYEANDAPDIDGFTTTLMVSATALDESDEDEQWTWHEGRAQFFTVYVEHPLVGLRMIPVASYHRVLFEDKACQAVELAADLGATRIEAEHLSGWGKEMAASIGFPKVTGSGSRSANDNSRFLFAATYRPNFTPPPADDWDEWNSHLVDEFPWLPHERTWQAMVRGRIDGTLLTYSLLVTFESDHDINAEVVGGIKRLGLSAGGTYTEFKRTSWRLDVTF